MLSAPQRKWKDADTRITIEEEETADSSKGTALLYYFFVLPQHCVLQCKSKVCSQLFWFSLLNCVTCFFSRGSFADLEWNTTVQSATHARDIIILYFLLLFSKIFDFRFILFCLKIDKFSIVGLENFMILWWNILDNLLDLHCPFNDLTNERQSRNYKKAIEKEQKNTYENTRIMVRGNTMISHNAQKRKIFRDWNSTRDIESLAPHQLFWPRHFCGEKTSYYYCPSSTINLHDRSKTLSRFYQLLCEIFCFSSILTSNNVRE